MKQSTLSVNSKENALLFVLFFAFLPVGIFRIWKSDKNLFVKILYTLLGMPLFLLVYSFLAIIAFAAFLPPLDLTVTREDRTIVNPKGNYATTFVKRGPETNYEYEFARVEVEPGGGNGPHYHKDFEEKFTVIEGELTVYQDNVPQTLHKGESAVVDHHTVHYFRNNTDSTIVITVQSTPSHGLEKSLRVAYGLYQTGQFQENGFTKNPWHMCLLLGYSGTYIADIPPVIQEPLVDAFAKIAQWKGEDKSLEVFYR